MQHLLCRAATKPELARTMIERFLDAGHHAGWVTGDKVYGGNPSLRTALEERGIGYVLAVACSAEVPTGAGKFRADALARKVPERARQKLSAGDGAKVQRFGSRTGPSSTSPRQPPAATSC
jgi:SRSO17 transposase